MKPTGREKTLIEAGLVTGHDFSRADKVNQINVGLQPLLKLEAAFRSFNHAFPLRFLALWMRRSAAALILLTALVSAQQAPPPANDASAQRKKQIADQSAQLLQLATDLKAEVDKTTKDTLSIRVIRKADAIEKLAHTVKGKTSTTASAN